MGAMSDPNYLEGEEIANREHTLMKIHRLPKKNRDKMVPIFENATLCLKDMEF